MIIKVITYEAQCDKCGNVFFHSPDEKTAHFHSPDEKTAHLFLYKSRLEAILNTCGWKNINGKLYCRECAEEVKKRR